MPRPRQAASLGQAASEWHGRSVERVVERVELGTNTGRFRETSKQTTEYQYKQNARDARAIPAARRAIVPGVLLLRTCRPTAAHTYDGRPAQPGSARAPRHAAPPWRASSSPATWPVT